MNALATILPYIIVALVLAWYIRYTRTHYKIGTLPGIKDTTYTYVIGDNLHYGDMPGAFNGVDVVMPASLPHIYLDGRVHENHKGPRHFMPDNQRLELEGDFNKIFCCLCAI